METLSAHRKTLEIRGVTRFDALISSSKVILARHLIYEVAAEHGLYTANGWKNSDGRFALDKAFRAALKALNTSDRFPKFIDSNLLQLAEELLGEAVEPLSPGQQILFTLAGAKS